MFEIAHEPGALADAMAIFKRNRLNMTWIESFPIPGHRGRYLFFVEFVGHHADPRAKPGDRNAGEKVAPPGSARLLCAGRAGRVGLDPLTSRIVGLVAGQISNDNYQPNNKPLIACYANSLLVIGK